MIGFLFGNIAAIKKIASLEKYKEHAYIKDGHIGVFPKVKTPEDNCKILLDFYTDLYNSEYDINEGFEFNNIGNNKTNKLVNNNIDGSRYYYRKL
jgi:hypothetical protein